MGYEIVHGIIIWVIGPPIGILSVTHKVTNSKSRPAYSLKELVNYVPMDFLSKYSKVSRLTSIFSIYFNNKMF